jgi:sRNA-binding protein
MARFFFHVTNGSTFKDAEGENCSSLEAARTSCSRRRESVNKVHKKRSRANKRKRFK